MRHSRLKVELGARVHMDPPETFNRLLRSELGRTADGQPNYRLVWGWSRMGWMGGFEEYETDVCDQYGLPIIRTAYMPTQSVPLYWPDLDRWYLERWNPPLAAGTPRRWRERTTVCTPWGETIERMGPYPNRGYYMSVLAIPQIPGVELPRGIFEIAIHAFRNTRDEFEHYKHLKVAAAVVEETRAARKASDDAVDVAWDNKVARPFSGPAVALPCYNPAMQRPRGLKRITEAA